MPRRENPRRVLPPRERYRSTTPETATKLYRMICAYIADNAFPPTLTEMAAAMYMSRGGVYRHLAHLEAWGYIDRAEHSARAITVINRDHIENPPEHCGPFNNHTGD
jgi:SOS-response transcriptional repressor LexA